MPSRKELAAALNCSPGYVSALRRQGLPELSTVDEARAWMQANPGASFARAYRGIKYATPRLRFATAETPQTPANTGTVYPLKTPA